MIDCSLLEGLEEPTRGQSNVNVRNASSLMGANAEHLSTALLDNEIRDFAIDSRAIKGGELFFALSHDDYERAGFNGSFADAHQFIPESFDRGAIAAVARTDRVDKDENLQALKGRLLLVKDAIAALQQLARR